MAYRVWILILSLLFPWIIYCLPINWITEIDVDAGKDATIISINEALELNLLEGDTKVLKDHKNNAAIGNEYLWPQIVPYYLDESLDMNAKGLILKAFDQYRLKSCIDFRPWEGEKDYIAVIKGRGCWSYVGNLHIGRQELSVGSDCDRISIIEHEFLHALGFWHEHSRSDRDDYVIIMWDRIETGKEHNFQKYDENETSSLNVPYDYTSVMHYSKTAFQNGSEPTIVTRMPEFKNVIGQNLEFSDFDIQKLNRLYGCTSSITFMEQCSFELPNICGMIQNSSSTASWQRVSMVSAGPSTDHTFMGACKDATAAQRDTQKNSQDLPSVNRNATSEESTSVTPSRTSLSSINSVATATDVTAPGNNTLATSSHITSAYLNVTVEETATPLITFPSSSNTSSSTTDDTVSGNATQTSSMYVTSAFINITSEDTTPSALSFTSSTPNSSSSSSTDSIAPENNTLVTSPLITTAYLNVTAEETTTTPLITYPSLSNASSSTTDDTVSGNATQTSSTYVTSAFINITTEDTTPSALTFTSSAPNSSSSSTDNTLSGNATQTSSMYVTPAFINITSEDSTPPPLTFTSSAPNSSSSSTDSIALENNTLVTSPFLTSSYLNATAEETTTPLITYPSLSNTSSSTTDFTTSENSTRATSPYITSVDLNVTAEETTTSITLVSSSNSLSSSITGDPVLGSSTVTTSQYLTSVSTTVTSQETTQTAPLVTFPFSSSSPSITTSEPTVLQSTTQMKTDYATSTVTNTTFPFISMRTVSTTAEPPTLTASTTAAISSSSSASPTSTTELTALWSSTQIKTDYVTSTVTNTVFPFTSTRTVTRTTTTTVPTTSKATPSPSSPTSSSPTSADATTSPITPPTSKTGYGYFMHFSTRTGTEMYNAFLETRILYPKRGLQCLQFYYYNSGNENDTLNIFVREYSGNHFDSHLLHIGNVTGKTLGFWQLQMFQLNVTKKFRVVFQGVKGHGASDGGISIDDINLSETQCPTHIWFIRNFTFLLNTSAAGDSGRIYSPRFYSKEGYGFQIGLYVNGTTERPSNLAVYFHLTSGIDDSQMQWPCPWKQVTMLLLDQNPDIRHCMSNQRSITTDPTEVIREGSSAYYFWDNPSKTGIPVTDPNGEKYFRGPGKGTSAFITHDRLHSRDYIKGDGVYLLITMEDISHLLQPEFVPGTCSNNSCENGGLCFVKKNKTECRCKADNDFWYMGERCEKKRRAEVPVDIGLASSFAAAASVLMTVIISVYCIRKDYYNKLTEFNDDCSFENTTSC